MGKSMICFALAMCTIIIVFYSCMVTTCTCICTGVTKNSRSSACSMCTKDLVLYGQTLLQHRAFITCSMSTHPSHSPWLYMLRSYLAIFGELSDRPTIACSICYVQLATTFTLNFGVATQLHVVATGLYRLEFDCQNHS